MLVELRFSVPIGHSIKVAEQVELLGFLTGGFAGFGAGHEVIDEDFGVDFFLDVQRRGVDDERFLLVDVVVRLFTAPDQVRVQVAIAPFVADLDGFFGFLIHDGLHLGGGDVGAFGVVVG